MPYCKTRLSKILQFEIQKMEIPNLPTGNIYSFTTILGIVLIVISTIYPNNRLNIIDEDSIILSGEVESLRIKSDDLNKTIDDYRSEIKLLDKKLDAKYDTKSDIGNLRKDVEKLHRKLADKDYREYLKFLYDYEFQIFPEFKELNETKVIGKEINIKLLELALINSDINTKRSIQKHKIAQERKWLILETVGLGIGLLLFIFGLRNWYIKVQKPLDEKILKKE